jgi:hypothetical protein
MMKVPSDGPEVEAFSILRQDRRDAREVKAFEWKVRMWSAEVPIASAVYLGLDPLNHSLQLMARILNGEKDGRGFERRYGEGGTE